MAATRKKDEVRVSLLPTEPSVPHPGYRRAMWILVMVFIAVVAGIILSLIYLRFDMARTRTGVAQTQAALDKELADIAEAQARVGAIENLGQIAGLAKTALNTHTDPVRVLQIIESAAISKVTLQQLAFDMKGTAVLSARADDFVSAVNQLVSWHKNPAIESVRFGTVSARVDKLGAIDGLDFTATIMFKSGMLSWNPK